MRLKRRIALVFSAFTLVLVGIIAYASLILLNPERIKPLLEQEVLQATGRTLRIQGDITHSISLSPSLVVSGIRLSNAPWGKNESLLQAEKLSVRFALLPLLRGRIELNALEIDDAQLWLEQQAEAENWQLEAPLSESNPAAAAPTTPSEAEPTPAANDAQESQQITIRSLRLNNLKLHHHNLSSGAQHHLDIEHLTFANANAQTIERFDLQGRYLDAELEASGSLAQDVLQVQLNLATKTSKAEAKGSVSLKDWVFDVVLSLDSSNFGELLALAGTSNNNAANTSLKLATSLGGNQKLISISSFEATYDGHSFAGSGKIDLSQNIPYLEGNVTAKTIDLRFDEPVIAATPEATPPAASPEAKPELMPRSPLPFDALFALNASLSLRIDTLQLNQAELSQLGAILTLNNGILSLTDITTTLADGTLKGSIEANASTSPPSLKLDATSDALTLGALLKATGSSDAIDGGRMRASLSLAGSGESLLAIASSASGHYAMLLEGVRFQPAASLYTISSFLNIMRGSNTSQGKPVDISCGIAEFDIAQGIATSKTLALQSKAAIVSGSGTVHLGEETLRLQLKARSTLLGLADVIPPLIISGNWASPSVSLSAEHALLSIGKMALGAVTGVGLIAVVGEQFTDRLGITADNNPCMQSLQDAADAAAKADANPKATAKSAEDNLRAVRDEVKGKAKAAEQEIKALRDGFKGLLKKE